MHIVAVALVTNSGGMDKGENWPDLVLDLGVAVSTFDLTIRHMFLMHEGRGMLGIQYFGFTMALETLPFGDMTISLNDMSMALLAGDPPGDILPVVEIPALDVDVAFGLSVARGAPPHRARDAFLFPFWSCPIKMTDETIRLVDS
jgi:hypothetical protein